MGKWLMKIQDTFWGRGACNRRDFWKNYLNAENSVINCGRNDDVGEKKKNHCGSIAMRQPKHEDFAAIHCPQLQSLQPF